MVVRWAACAARLDLGQQPRSDLLSWQANQVDVDLGAQQPRQLTILDPHLHEAVVAVRVVQERAGPLIGAVG
jgi:hypothetical protein